MSRPVFASSRTVDIYSIAYQQKFDTASSGSFVYEKVADAFFTFAAYQKSKEVPVAFPPVVVCIKFFSSIDKCITIACFTILVVFTFELTICSVFSLFPLSIIEEIFVFLCKLTLSVNSFKSFYHFVRAATRRELIEKSRDHWLNGKCRLNSDGARLPM